jgi:hypothetical protein
MNALHYIGFDVHKKTIRFSSRFSSPVSSPVCSSPEGFQPTLLQLGYASEDATDDQYDNP